MSSPWIHAICDPCWEKIEPGRHPHRIHGFEPVPCCWCGDTTNNIYLRARPAYVPCLGVHPEAS